MAAPYEWLISSRYVRGAGGRGFLSFISVVSMLGLAIGVAVLIVVLSVMNGFARELQTRILSVTSHAELTACSRTVGCALEANLTDWRRGQAQALKLPGVIAAVPYIDAQALLVHGARSTGSAIRGVLPAEERRAVGIADRIQGGSIDALADGSYRIILGDVLAAQLRVTVGDTLVLVAPLGVATPAGVQPRMRRFRVAGLFHSGMYEYDSALAMINMRDAARIYEMGDTVTGIRLALRDPFKAPQTARQLAVDLGGGFIYTTWMTSHENFFRSIQITKSLLFMILVLVVAVAAFNIVAALVMVVKDKRSDIAILRTLGAAPRNVLAVFSIQGAVIGLVGTALGAALGLILAANMESLVHGLEHLLGTHFLNAKVYLMSDLPAYAEWGDVLKICATAFILCALATLYPAWRAAGTHPAEALRHE